MVKMVFPVPMPGLLDAFVEGAGVPKALRFAYGERVAKVNLISDEKRFAAFKRDELFPGGFFLKTEHLLVRFERIDDAHHSVWALGIKKRAVAESFFEDLCAFNPLFGFCCTWDEYWVRNNVWHEEFGSGDHSSSSYLGRDLKRYIPGLYWRTVISTELADRHGVDLVSLGPRVPQHEKLSDTLHLFAFGDDPLGHRNDDIADRLCRATPGLFNWDLVMPQWRAAKDWRERFEIEYLWP
jgi:hypothetical protein